MDKNLLIVPTLVIFFVAVSHGVPREISQSEVWKGNYYFPNDIEETKKPAADFPALTGGKITVEDLREAYMKLQNSKEGKQRDPRDIVTELLCWLFGCGPVATTTATTAATTAATTRATTTPTTTRATTPSITTTTTRTTTVALTTRDFSNCTPIQIILNTCPNGGGGGGGGAVTTTSPSATTVRTTAAPGSIISEPAFNGTLEYAASYNLAMVKRTRRPTQFKIGKNCKNKPTKHSQEIDDEDRDSRNNL